MASLHVGEFDRETDCLALTKKGVGAHQAGKIYLTAIAQERDYF